MMKKSLSLLLLFSIPFLVACSKLSIPGHIQGNSHNQQHLSDDQDSSNLSKKKKDKSLLMPLSGLDHISIQQTGGRYLYDYTLKEIPLKVSFMADELILPEEVIPKNNGHSRKIPKFKLNHIGSSNPSLGSSLTQEYSFGLNCLPKYEDWLHRSFPSGSGELFVPAPNVMNHDMTYPYINHLEKPVERHSFFFPYYGNRNIGKEECLIEIGKISDFETLPFKLGKGFEDATIAITSNKNQTGNCMQYFPNHTMLIAFFTDEVECSIWLDSPTSLREIKQP